jgi:hypothetical protein
MVLGSVFQEFFLTAFSITVYWVSSFVLPSFNIFLIDLYIIHILDINGYYFLN